MQAPQAAANNPAAAGDLASRKAHFGEFRRFAVYAVHTRHGSVQWFVADAETPGAAGLPAIVRQAGTFDAAVRGLDA